MAGCDVGPGVGTLVGAGRVNGVGMTRMNTPMAPMTTSTPTTSQSVAFQLYGGGCAGPDEGRGE